MSSNHESTKKHIFGFAASILLTLMALFIGIGTSLPLGIRISAIVFLAIVQLLIQLIYFMHITEGSARVYNYINIAFGIFIAVVVVAGSLWIMLYNTMGL